MRRFFEWFLYRDLGNGYMCMRRWHAWIRGYRLKPQ